MEILSGSVCPAFPFAGPTARLPARTCGRQFACIFFKFGSQNFSRFFFEYHLGHAVGGPPTATPMVNLGHLIENFDEVGITNVHLVLIPVGGIWSCARRAAYNFFEILYIFVCVLVGDAEGDLMKGKACDPLPEWALMIFQAGLNALRSAVNCVAQTSLTFALTFPLIICLMLVTVLRICMGAQVTDANT
jgi:hypothetical protein